MLKIIGKEWNVLTPFPWNLSFPNAQNASEILRLAINKPQTKIAYFFEVFFYLFFPIVGLPIIALVMSYESNYTLLSLIVLILVCFCMAMCAFLIFNRPSHDDSSDTLARLEGVYADEML